MARKPDDALAAVALSLATLLAFAAASVLLVFPSAASATGSAVECNSVSTLMSSCDTYITYGAPDPELTSPCCDAVVSLNNVAADSPDSRRSMCGCLMALVAAYSPNATAVARLPGLCGVSLGFTIDPSTDCTNVGSELLS